MYKRQALSYSTAQINEVPNLDSTRIEFDEGNLFQLDQAPGYDARSTGFAGHLGLSWRRTTANNRFMQFTAGKLIRQNQNLSLAQSSGIADRNSDLLLTAHYESGSGLSILSRAIVGGDSGLRKAETRLGYKKSRFDLNLTHSWLEADEAELRPIAFSEITASAGVNISERVRLNTTARYDARTDELSNVTASVTIFTSCLRVDFSMSERFSKSAAVPSVTEYGFRINMAQFGVGSSLRTRSQKCRGAL